MDWSAEDAAAARLAEDTRGEGVAEESTEEALEVFEMLEEAEGGLEGVTKEPDSRFLKEAARTWK